ncbi:hypothetical protein C9446_11295 [Providencia heimbachae]|nr:hypothetical protein C9446_11295 [Providencia heimbachae]
MQINAKKRLKRQAKKMAVNKGLKILLTLLITYGPGGIFAKLIKILSSKWLLSYLTKRITR